MFLVIKNILQIIKLSKNIYLKNMPVQNYINGMPSFSASEHISLGHSPACISPICPFLR